jgi:hypothetical protein
MTNPRARYIVEPRNGSHLASNEECAERYARHPYLRSKPTFSIDELCHWVSFGEGRNSPCGPSETFAFLQAIGLPAREKTW